MQTYVSNLLESTKQMVIELFQFHSTKIIFGWLPAVILAETSATNELNAPKQTSPPIPSSNDVEERQFNVMKNATCVRCRMKRSHNGWRRRETFLIVQLLSLNDGLIQVKVIGYDVEDNIKHNHV